MRGGAAGGVVDENKDRAHGVELQVFAVEKVGGTKVMDVMEVLAAKVGINV